MNRTLAIIVVATMTGACAPTQISPNWGTAYQHMRAAQVLNPSAGESLEPVEGQDGTVNATAMDAYRKAFEKPDSDFTKSVVSSGVKTN
jgi:type IV pilus biogenesis protein CpaD/CtpE